MGSPEVFKTSIIDIENNIYEDRNSKRGPTTPLPVQKQTFSRRKFELMEPQTPTKYIEMDADVMECKYMNWKLQQELNKSQKIIKFMELERKYNLERD